jgi:Calcineurin-like phosphoesterase
MIVRRWHRSVLAVAAISGLTVTVVGTAPASGSASRDDHTFAVIGDIPYGDAQLADFPRVIAQINADPEVQWVDHLGDIKSGSSVCSDEYFQLIKADFDQFDDPFVYTFGDNEWTDCHRANNGGYNPLERLAKIREVFFPRPGRTMGRHSAPVLSQADQGIPENVRWERSGVSFAALHVVGSDNSLAPWTGNTAATPEQTAEVLARTAAVTQLVHDTFTNARDAHSKAVVLLLQADMFDPTVADPRFADFYSFQPIVAAIARESAAFRRPVYLFNGDSHVFNSDNPLAEGSKWLPIYGIDRPVPNLSRVTVDGSTNIDNYLRVTVHKHGPQVLTWTRVPLTS